MIRFFAILFACCLSVKGATSMSIITATAAENQLYYVIAGDGFSEANQSGFLHFATNVAQALTNGTYNNWIRTNNNRINVLVCQTNSVQNGVTASAPNSDTPMGGYVDGSSCRVDVTKMAAILSDVGLYNGTYKRIIVLNRGDYLGTTLSGRTVITTNAEMNIVVHESAHLFNNIGDEYAGGVFAAGGYVNNAATLTEATNRWLVNFPTLGAPVSVSGEFVPTATCKLGADISQQFCVVCSNEFVQTLSWTNVAALVQQSSRPNFNIGTLRLR